MADGGMKGDGRSKSGSPEMGVGGRDHPRSLSPLLRRPQPEAMQLEVVLVDRVDHVVSQFAPVDGRAKHLAMTC